MSELNKIRVGVLRGGPSGEYEISLQSGATVLENLSKEKYQPVDIFIDKKGVWHLHGLTCLPEKAVRHLDVVFNAMHGEYGEDGKVQQILEHFKIPYTGSNSLSSALAMNKITSRRIFEKYGLKIARAKMLNKQEANFLKIFEIFSLLVKPLVVKPASAGSSLGVNIVDSMENFTDALDLAFKYSPNILVEEFVRGREITCGVVERVGHASPFALPPIEIRPPTGKFFDYQAKYDGSTEEICPAELPEDLSGLAKKNAISAHQSLGLRHYSRTDMIIGENGDIYVLETNTLPGMTAESLLPKSVKASGSSLPEFLDHILTLALNKR